MISIDCKKKEHHSGELNKVGIKMLLCESDAIHMPKDFYMTLYIESRLKILTFPIKTDLAFLKLEPSLSYSGASFLQCPHLPPKLRNKSHSFHRMNSKTNI